MKGKCDGNERAFVRYMEYAARLHEVDKALKCARLQVATSSSGEVGDDMERGEEDSDVVAADNWSGVIPF